MVGPTNGKAVLRQTAHADAVAGLCVAQLVERRSLTGELSLSYARPAADG